MVSLRLGLLASRSLAVWIPFVLLVSSAAACGPTYTSADDDSNDDGAGGTDGSDGSDSPDGTGGAADGGGGDNATGGDTASGGSDGSGGTDSSGGTDGTGGDDGDDGACGESNECVAAADMDQACYSPDCAVPVAVTQSEMEHNPCLVPWAQRDTMIPEECAGADDDAVCPAISCEIPPPCVTASCSDVTHRCALEFCTLP